MKFYLSSSKQLLFLFVFLYSAMMIAVTFSAIHVLLQISLLAILLLFAWHSIKKYALLLDKDSNRRICCQGDTWCFANNYGAYTAGMLSSSSYVTKVLIILQIKSNKKKAINFMLIAADSLPHLQFRRLSMKLGN